MAQMYETTSKTTGHVVKLYECSIRKGFTHCVLVEGTNRSFYTDNLADAYREYNKLAR